MAEILQIFELLIWKIDDFINSFRIYLTFSTNIFLNLFQVTDLKQKLSKAELSLDESRQKQESLFFAERQLKQWKGLCYRLLTTAERSEFGNDFGPDILGKSLEKLLKKILFSIMVLFYFFDFREQSFCITTRYPCQS